MRVRFFVRLRLPRAAVTGYVPMSAARWWAGTDDLVGPQRAEGLPNPEGVRLACRSQRGEAGLSVAKGNGA